MLPRAVAMLAVAAQLPDGVLAKDPCGVTREAPANSELEPAPEASASAATASTAQVAVPTDLILTRKPPLAWTNETRRRSKPCASLTRALSHQKHWSWRPVPHHRAPGAAAGQDIPAAKEACGSRSPGPRVSRD